MFTVRIATGFTKRPRRERLLIRHGLVGCLILRAGNGNILYRLPATGQQQCEQSNTTPAHPSVVQRHESNSIIKRPTTPAVVNAEPLYQLQQPAK